MKDFSWTPAPGTYKNYPPYVNLTGNMLIVRGSEFTGEDGHPRMGITVALNLPDEAIAELAAALKGADQ